MININSYHDKIKDQGMNFFDRKLKNNENL